MVRGSHILEKFAAILVGVIFCLHISLEAMAGQYLHLKNQTIDARQLAAQIKSQQTPNDKTWTAAAKSWVKSFFLTPKLSDSQAGASDYVVQWDHSPSLGDI